LGVGATFPKEVYKEWGKHYKAETGSSLAYFAHGSGKGIEAISAGKADFGASDKPLTRDELERHKLVQFPALIGGVVPVVNIRHVGDGQLQLDGAVLANIYLGNIKRWNDPAIVALNPRLALPNEPINVVHRSDQSGSTFVLTDYLSKVSADWKASMGAGTAVAWKVGEGADGGDGLAKKIGGTPNSIGYIDPALVQQRHMTFAKMRNHDGEYVSPDQGTFAAAAANANWNASGGYGQSLTNLPGHDSWPLATATYILVARSPAETSGTEATLKYFDWTFRNGNVIAQNLGFVLIPAEAMQSIRDTWKIEIKDRAGRPIWQ
jgi:phosphate transport system substrate-binding protein